MLVAAASDPRPVVKGGCVCSSLLAKVVGGCKTLGKELPELLVGR